LDTKTLVVGQEVYINGGFGPVEGKIVKVDPPCIYVEIANGRFRFNSDGKECGLDGKAFTYASNVMFGPGPWELKSLDEVHFARNVSIWLIEFLKGGEKPADEVLMEAEKKFGDAGDAVRRASDQLNVSKRQENSRWYWSLRWKLDENNVVLRLAPN
jgi:hypothetical protein